MSCSCCKDCLLHRPAEERLELVGLVFFNVWSWLGMMIVHGIWLRQRSEEMVGLRRDDLYEYVEQTVNNLGMGAAIVSFCCVTWQNTYAYWRRWKMS